MRLINAIAMATMAAVVVATAFASRHAVSLPAANAPAEAARPADEGGKAAKSLADDNKTVLVVTRAKQGRLKRASAASAWDVEAFSLALGRTFARTGDDLAAHTTPLPLPTGGALAAGFVAKVKDFGGRCGFAIGGLDYTGKLGADGLDASAALIFCAESAEKLQEMAEPSMVAARLATLPQR